MAGRDAIVGDPPWMAEARRHIGLAEIPGAPTNGVIAGWLRRLRAWWDDDETPWCGVFVAACLATVFERSALPRYWMRAKAWAEWGITLPYPVPGCIVVFERQGGGHVGFVVGRSPSGLLLVLGGNQGNQVSVAQFDPGRVIAYRWPVGVAVDYHAPLLVLDAAGAPLSRNEA